MKKVLRLVLQKQHDYDSIPDDLGTFADQPDEMHPSSTIDRQARGEQGRGEYRYFIAMNSPEETGNPNSVEQDYKRYMDFNNQKWHFISVKAVAEVKLTDNGPIQQITSGGLYGIESDSDESEIERIIHEEKEECIEQLMAMEFEPKDLRPDPDCQPDGIPWEVKEQ